ncbi:TOMM precursor leader peptide-binding protein [Krasilnikovia sp. M28-CT-15]|uniref:TOMM precursor leader peptide-binding protein n=1 Tax=Krasilnikovia sp. M28-CT-15 TaxID=3373540 RepID=UPI0038778C7B
MTTTEDTPPTSLLRLRDGVAVEDRDGEVAVYLADLGGGSMLRGVPALMFSSLYRRFGAEAFTVRDAVEDGRSGDPETWRRVLSALTNRGILISGERQRGTVSAPERMRVHLDGSDADAARLAALVASTPTVELVEESVADIAVRLDDRLDIAGALAFARRQASLRRQSLTVRVYGANAELGPWTVPGRTPCFECYWARLQAGRETRPPESLLGSEATPAPQGAARPLAAEASLTLLASEVGKAAAGAPPVTLGQVVRLELGALEIVKHRVISVPACPTCAVSR